MQFILSDIATIKTLIEAPSAEEFFILAILEKQRLIFFLQHTNSTYFVRHCNYRNINWSTVGGRIFYISNLRETAINVFYTAHKCNVFCLELKMVKIELGESEKDEESNNITLTEADVLYKNVFLKISQISQENTFVGVSF